MSFLLESSFVALTSIVVGTLLGLAVAYNVVADAKRAPSWENMTFHVPWLTLAGIFLLVYGVVLATTLAPARPGRAFTPRRRCATSDRAATPPCTRRLVTSRSASFAYVLCGVAACSRHRA